VFGKYQWGRNEATKKNIYIRPIYLSVFLSHIRLEAAGNMSFRDIDLINIPELDGAVLGG
jgi:hypothetical protein